MQIMLNGQKRTFDDNITIQQMLDAINMHPQRVAIEVNREIIKREQYGSHQIHDGDEVEVLQFVGGGSTLVFHSSGERDEAKTIRRFAYI